jgi:hypothetical protein
VPSLDKPSLSGEDLGETARALVKDAASLVPELAPLAANLLEPKRASTLGAAEAGGDVAGSYEDQNGRCPIKTPGSAPCRSELVVIWLLRSASIWDGIYKLLKDWRAREESNP